MVGAAPGNASLGRRGTGNASLVAFETTSGGGPGAAIRRAMDLPALAVVPRAECDPRRYVDCLIFCDRRRTARQEPRSASNAGREAARDGNTPCGSARSTDTLRLPGPRDRPR